MRRATAGGRICISECLRFFEGAFRKRESDGVGVSAIVLLVGRGVSQAVRAAPVVIVASVSQAARAAPAVIFVLLGGRGVSQAVRAARFARVCARESKGWVGSERAAVSDTGVGLCLPCAWTMTLDMWRGQELAARASGSAYPARRSTVRLRANVAKEIRA